MCNIDIQVLKIEKERSFEILFIFIKQWYIKRGDERSFL